MSSYTDNEGGEWAVGPSSVSKARVVGGDGEDLGPDIPDNFSPTLALRMVERGRKTLIEGCATPEAFASVNATADWLAEVLARLLPVTE